MIRFYGAVFSLLFLLSACAPHEQEFRATERQPVLLNDVYIAPDNARLPIHRWMPEHPRAILVALHGFNDYGTAFKSPARYLMKQNIGVISYDQRGFGRTNNIGIWGGEENLVSDLSEIVRLTKKEHPNTPVFVLGESMGGAVAIVAASHPDFPQVSGIILVAPAVWGNNTLNPLLRASLWVAAHTFPSSTIISTGDRFKILASSNIKMLLELGCDPLFIKHTRVDSVYGLVHLMDDAYAGAGKVKPPILMLYGAHDQIIPPKPIRDTLLKLQDPYRFAYYPDGYHMLLRDLQAEVVLKDIAAWTHNTKAPLPSGLDKRWDKYLKSPTPAKKDVSIFDAKRRGIRG